MAVSLQSDLRCISGSNSDRSVCSSEAAAFLLAKAAKGNTGEVVPGHVISNMLDSRHQGAIKPGNFRQNPFSFQCFLLKVEAAHFLPFKMATNHLL